MEYLSSIQNRISSMAIVHESLYSDENADYIDFEEYAKNLINHIKYSFEREDQQVQITFNIIPLQLPLEKIILLGLILNEAVSNSFKYTMISSNLCININVVKVEEFILLNINDNGPGFNTNLVSEKSLGLKLIQIMSMQLDAKYELESENGVRHTLKFKL
jgi:two-component sensor histidine kinase